MDKDDIVAVVAATGLVIAGICMAVIGLIISIAIPAALVGGFIAIVYLIVKFAVGL